MELFWLVMALGALLMAFYMIGERGWAAGGIFLIFPLMAAAMYGLRRATRGREQYKE